MMAVGVAVLPVRPGAAGAFYSFALVWSAGFSLCALTLDRQVVVLAQREGRPVADALRTLWLWWILFGVLLCAVLGYPASQLGDLSLANSFVALALGAAAGIAEAILWSLCAEAGKYKTLAALRALACGAFLVGAALWMSGAGERSVALPFLFEFVVLVVASIPVAAAPLMRATSMPLAPRTVLGFWMNRAVTYLSMQLDAWWTVVALSPVILAAYRVGTPLRSFILLSVAALLQPLIFKISSQDWSAHRDAAQRSVSRIVEGGVLISSLFAIALAITVLISSEVAERYAVSVTVAWLVLSFHSGIGWFGMLGSTLLANRGAIRLPLIVTVTSILLRSAVYFAFLSADSLDIVTLILATESLLFLTQLLYWKQVLKEELWRLNQRDFFSLALRATLAITAVVIVSTARQENPTISATAIVSLHAVIVLHALFTLLQRRKA